MAWQLFGARGLKYLLLFHFTLLTRPVRVAKGLSLTMTMFSLPRNAMERRPICRGLEVERIAGRGGYLQHGSSRPQVRLTLSRVGMESGRTLSRQNSVSAQVLSRGRRQLEPFFALAVGIVARLNEFVLTFEPGAQSNASGS